MFKPYVVRSRTPQVVHKVVLSLGISLVDLAGSLHLLMALAEGNLMGFWPP